jgi:hypothetical protein
LLIFIKWMLYIVSYRHLSFEFQNLWIRSLFFTTMTPAMSSKST